MADDIITETPEIWGTRFSTDSSAVERAHDRFGDGGAYDETFEEWGYVGPETAAAILRNYVPTDSRILDAACGSGLTGVALARGRVSPSRSRPAGPASGRARCAPSGRSRARRRSR